MKYFKKLAGKRIYLSPMNTDDGEVYTRWLNDLSVSGNLGMFRQMISLNSEQKVLEKMTCEGQNFAIVLSGEDLLIGNISLMDIDQVSRIATVGIFIGEAEQRGKGYGTEALQLILDYGFKTLNLHNIMLHVHSDNKQGVACYKKVGFREFGRRREAVYKNGGYVDDIHMEMLDTEFCQR